MGLAVAAPLVADMDDLDAMDVELVAGEKRKAEVEARKAVPPKVVGQWNFDDMVPGKAGHPKGWWSGIWGDRKVNYGSDVGADGTGRCFLLDVRSITGGELQVFSGGWTLKKEHWYKVTFKMRGWDHPGTVGVTVREYAGKWRTPIGSITVRPTEEWKEYTFGGKSGIYLSGGFGIMIGAGTAGQFAIDDVKVEEFLENPFPPPKPAPPVPFTAGNLIPHPSFETAIDPFWCFYPTSFDTEDIFLEPVIERVEGAFSGAHSLKCTAKRRKDGKLASAGSLESLTVPVAAGRRYLFSLMARTDAPVARVKLECKAGRDAMLANGFADVRQGDGWRKVSCVTKPIPENVREVRLYVEFAAGEDVFIDAAYFGEYDKLAAGKFIPATPYELGISFEKGKPGVDPHIVEWGDKLPLEIGVWPVETAMQNAQCTMQNGVMVGATLKVTGYPDKKGSEEHFDLVVGEKRRIDFDPGLNGVLRVELIPDDPSAAKPIEAIMGRLPKPRATGAKGRFGIHARVCPQILAYARAIGLTWERIHDCSNLTKMGYANPEPGVYRWADEQVDALRSYGFAILGMPDYPPKWLYKEVSIEDQGAKKRAEARENAITMPNPDDMFVDPDEAEILADADTRRKEADKALRSHTEIIYDKAAFRTFCRELASHFKGRIDHFEMWNEPYWDTFFKGSGSHFMEVFHEGAKGIREGNPDAKVLGYCNEFNCAGQYAAAAKKFPLEEKVDYNSMHYYYMGIPGTGEFGIEKIVASYPKAFGKWVGSELWNTEGNMFGGSSFHADRFRRWRDDCETHTAFGARVWTETFLGGVDRVFIFGMFNTDGSRNGYYLNTIDYDRSLNGWGAATATTAYFIDAMAPHREIPSPKGAKLRIFTGDGRTSAVIFDDCLERGRPIFDASKLPSEWEARDGMGNELRKEPEGKAPLSPLPFFIAAEGVEPADLASAISAALVAEQQP